MRATRRARRAQARAATRRAPACKSRCARSRRIPRSARRGSGTAPRSAHGYARIETRSEFLAGARASLPVLLGVVAFGVIAGVAMVASGIAPLAAMLMSLLVFAGASMVASAQLLSSGTPVLLVLLTTIFINLRFMMYSASLRLQFRNEPLRWRLLFGYLIADNVYGLTLMRSAEKPAPREFFLGAGVVVW